MPTVFRARDLSVFIKPILRGRAPRSRRLESPPILNGRGPADTEDANAICTAGILNALLKRGAIINSGYISKRRSREIGLLFDVKVTRPVSKQKILFV